MEVQPNSPVNCDNLPQIDTVDLVPVDLNYRKMRLMSWGMAQGVLLILILSPVLASLLGWIEYPSIRFWWIPLCFQALVAGIWFLEEWKGFARRGYAIRERDVTYQTGWMVRNTTTIPYVMIQHSELSQGPVSRWLGINHIKLFTAGGSGNLRIAGIQEDRAQELRAIIEARAGKA